MSQKKFLSKAVKNVGKSTIALHEEKSDLVMVIILSNKEHSNNNHLQKIIDNLFCFFGAST